MKCRGFTLIELVVTLAVLSLLVGIGGPVFVGAIRSAGAATAMSDMTVAMATARIEAIRRNAPVSVCPSNDGLRCRENAVWDAGWIVFADPARTAQPASRDAVLHRFAALHSGLAARATQGRTYVRFQPSGWSAGTNLSIRLCDTSSNRLLSTVVLNNAGRSRVERASSALPCPYHG